MGIQGAAHKGEDDEILYWQEKYIILVNAVIILIFKSIIYNYFRLLKEAYNRIIKPWLHIGWICSLTESGKQLYTARKNVLNFIYSVNF